MIPSKKQWVRWSLPSKMTAVGLYLAVFSFLLPLVIWLFSQFYQWLSGEYEVFGVSPSSAYLDEKLGGNYEERKDDVVIQYPQISHWIPNKIFDAVNEEIESSALSSLRSNLYEYKFDYVVGLKSREILSLKMEQYYYYYPAANGNGSVTAINMDLEKIR